MIPLPDGLVVVAKQACPTCVLVEPLLAELAAAGACVTVYSQDDAAYGRGATHVVDDTGLDGAACKRGAPGDVQAALVDGELAERRDLGR